MENSSILLDRTPTTFKLQWRFNFQLLRADQRRDAFFRVSRTFCAKCELCVFSCHLNDEKGVQTVQNWRPNYWQSSPWRCRRNIGLSSLLFPTDTESEEREGHHSRPVYIDRGRSGLPPEVPLAHAYWRDFVRWQFTESETWRTCQFSKWRVLDCSLPLTRLRVNCNAVTSMNCQSVASYRCTQSIWDHKNVSFVLLFNSVSTLTGGRRWVFVPGVVSGGTKLMQSLLVFSWVWLAAFSSDWPLSVPLSTSRTFFVFILPVITLKKIEQNSSTLVWQRLPPPSYTPSPVPARVRALSSNWRQEQTKNNLIWLSLGLR